jgi:hypothetical protein
VDFREQGVEKIIFSAEREEVARDWRKLHCVELHDLFFLPNTIRVIRSRNSRGLEEITLCGAS